MKKWRLRSTNCRAGRCSGPCAHRPADQVGIWGWGPPQLLRGPARLDPRPGCDDDPERRGDDGSDPLPRSRPPLRPVPRTPWPRPPAVSGGQERGRLPRHLLHRRRLPPRGPRLRRLQRPGGPLPATASPRWFVATGPRAAPPPGGGLTLNVLCARGGDLPRLRPSPGEREEGLHSLPPSHRPGSPAGASKAAVDALVRSCASFASEGIRVYGVDRGTPELTSGGWGGLVRTICKNKEVGWRQW